MKRFLWVIALLASCSARAESVREPVVAGSWYPGDAKSLGAAVDGYLEKAEPPSSKARPAGLVSPHAGYRWSGAVAGHAYRALKGHEYKRVIVLGPAHRFALRGASILKVTHYATPLGRIPLDGDVCDALLREDHFATEPRAHAREHSLEIQLPFLQRVLKDFKLVPIVIGHAGKDVLGKIAASLARHVDKDTLLVASSDFTHYGAAFGYVPFRTKIEENIKKLDMGAVKFILETDSDGFYGYRESTRATICGAMPIFILLKILGEGCRGELIKYDTSGRMSGSFSSSVSYVAAALYRDRPAKGQGLLDETERKVLLGISRKVLESWIRDGKRPKIDLEGNDITKRMGVKRGVFVTLKNKSRLRGCIGYIVGRKPVVEAVIDNTSNSCQDMRFRHNPITPDELGDIRISISVMGELIPVNDVGEIEVGRDGLILHKGYHRGVLLPQVPVEQGWDRDRFLDGICRKAGIPSGGWKKGAKMWRFGAQVFGEE